MNTAQTDTTIQKKPAFIVICGGECSGKSSVMDALKVAYPQVATATSNGAAKVVFTREVGGTPLAEDIRYLMFKNPLGAEADALTMLHLAFASRRDHIQRKVKPARKTGWHVISDRGDSCTYACQVYGQIGQGQEQERDTLKTYFWLTRALHLRDCMPDLYIHLDVSVDEILRRMAKRLAKNKSHFDLKPYHFHERVRRGYLDFVKKVVREGSVAVNVDASQPIETVRVQVLDIVGKLIPRSH